MPTLVEVKRASDTRIRREVVGQMLDYAANGVRYWPVETLQVAFESTQRALGKDPEVEVAGLCAEPDLTVEGFFVRVADNLRAGRIRMVFVADIIPDELRRITEFLNEQMKPADVFAVEVKQYRAEGHKDSVIVPTVYGRTATASAKSPPMRRGSMQELLAKADGETRELAQVLEDLASEQALLLRTTPAGLQLVTSQGRTVAQLYVEYNAVDVSLAPVRSRGFDAEADAAFAALQRMTPKQLTPKYPSVPSRDAMRDLPALRGVLASLSQLDPRDGIQTDV